MQPIQELKKSMEMLRDLKGERATQDQSNSVLAQHVKLIGLRIGALSREGQNRALKIINEVLFNEESGTINYLLQYIEPIETNQL
jgi:hypothetical protein